MPNYYLKTASDSYCYRVAYSVAPTGSPPAITIEGVFVSGASVVLPDGTSGSFVDAPIESSTPLIDHVLGNVVPGTNADYAAAISAVVSTW